MKVDGVALGSVCWLGSLPALVRSVVVSIQLLICESDKVEKPEVLQCLSLTVFVISGRKRSRCAMASASTFLQVLMFVCPGCLLLSTTRHGCGIRDQRPDHLSGCSHDCIPYRRSSKSANPEQHAVKPANHRPD